MGRRRVVITGLGAISSLGDDVASTWSAVEEGRTAIGPMEPVDDLISFKNGADVRGFDPKRYFESREDQTLDRTTHSR